MGIRRGNRIQKLKKLFAVISESVPFTPDLKRLKNLVEIGDERTLKNYLKYLEDGGTIIALPKSGSGLRGMGKPEKIYLNNTNGPEQGYDDSYSQLPAFSLLHYSVHRR